MVNMWGLWVIEGGLRSEQPGDGLILPHGTTSCGPLVFGFVPCLFWLQAQYLEQIWFGSPDAMFLCFATCQKCCYVFFFFFSGGGTITRHQVQEGTADNYSPAS